MNRRPPGLETVKAIQGFLQYKSAEGLSARTIESYERDLQQWVDYQGGMDVAKVTPQQLRQYLTYLLTEYVPRRLTGHNDVKLSPKTVRNMWVTLSSFFHWAGDEFQIPNPMKMVPAPKCETPPVEPFRREEIEAILKVCDYCQEAKTNDRHKFTMRRVTGFRDKAIVLVLVDSGMRASELCTFAITYLRSGGDLFTLQRLLGHATLEMVQHYARIADVDVEQAHRKASPADNWRL